MKLAVDAAYYFAKLSDFEQDILHEVYFDILYKLPLKRWIELFFRKLNITAVWYNNAFIEKKTYFGEMKITRRRMSIIVIDFSIKSKEMEENNAE